MSVASSLAAGRRAAEARMTSRATVRRRTGRAPRDVNGYVASTWAVVHTSIPMRLAHASRSRGVEVGGVEFEEASGLAHFPHTVIDLRDGDLIEVVSGEWPGTVWRLVEAIKGDQSTARRVPIVEVERPGEW